MSAGCDLTESLQAARRRLERRKMPKAELSTMLKTTPRLRQALPTKPVIDRAVRRGRKLWDRDPEIRRQARGALETIISGTARDGEQEHLARMHVIEAEANRALFWQPWRPALLDAASIANVHAGRLASSGVILSFCHMGPFFHAASLARLLGRTLYSVGGAWCFEPPSANYWGRRLVRRLEGLREHDGRLVPAAGSYRVLRALLDDREAVLLHFDVPGSQTTNFLGRPVMLAAGTARLAVETGATVLPTRMRRVGAAVHADVDAPLLPERFTNAGALHRALAAVHERWILELPHTLEDPRRPGSWESGATAASWLMPAHAATPAQRDQSFGATCSHT